VFAGPGLVRHEEMYCSMTDTSQATTTTVQLTDNDIAYLLTLLRNSSSPLTLQQLVDALRTPAGR
jgi:hypothetical protein